MRASYQEQFDDFTHDLIIMGDTVRDIMTAACDALLPEFACSQFGVVAPGVVTGTLIDRHATHSTVRRLLSVNFRAVLPQTPSDAAAVSVMVVVSSGPQPARQQ